MPTRRRRPPLNALAFKRCSDLRVPKCFRIARRHCILATTWLTGEPLDVRLRAGSAMAWPAAHESCVRAGAALAALHAQRPPLQRRWDASHLAEALSVAADAVSAVAPRLASDAVSLAETVMRRVAQADPLIAPVHGDFGPDQVITSEGACGIVDFDHAGWGDRRLDLGSFRARLLAMEAAGAGGAVPTDAAWAALLDGYHAAGGTIGPPAVIDLYTAVALLRAAVEPFRTRHSRWPELIELSLRRCLQLVCGKVHA